MKKNMKAVLLLTILVILTGIFAVVHLSTRESVNAGEIQLTYKDAVYSVDFKDLELEAVSGTRVNGKGEEKKVEGRGILLGKILEKYGIQEYSKVSVVSDDSYSAQISVEEIKADKKVYLLLEEEEARLVVFGDKDSKRSVSNVKQIMAE